MISAIRKIGAERMLFALLSMVTLASCERGSGERRDSAAIRADIDTVHVNGDPASTAPLSAPDAHEPPASSGEPGNGSRHVVNDVRAVPTDELRVLRFAWRPPEGGTDAYAMDDVEDQHRIVLSRGTTRGGAHPVVVAFHGQPKRGEAPRNYAFADRVIGATVRAVERRDVRPVVLVLPVFRYFGTNWPAFDVEAFRNEIDRRLAAQGIEARGYYLVGHSGAAGCGGDGMNRAHRMRPLAVGFFDTCLGRGWRDEVERLRAARIPTLLIHSLETAGFSPRQPTEYSPTFDFGLAYGPAGLAPSACPAELPSAKLRDQPFRCSSDERGTTRGLIVDSGKGEEGHNALVPIAVEYFLKQYVGAR